MEVLNIKERLKQMMVNKLYLIERWFPTFDTIPKSNRAGLQIHLGH